MRERNFIAALRGLFRQNQKRLLRIVRLSRKWNLRRKAEYVSITLLFVSVFIRFLYFPSPQRDGVPSAHSGSVPKFTRQNRHQRRDPEVEAQREIELATRMVCERTVAHENVEELKICGNFGVNTAGNKIVGLVEVRNVERTVATFLSALSLTVDSIVLIDDHSSDATRSAILDFNMKVHRIGAGRPVVEVLLNKSGNWVRDELLDRQLLLEAGRHVGGTHFVVLDYDEYLSANCVENGLLRNTILSLNPGESLYLPWVEVWKSTSLQRVLPGDPGMNFLMRRQIAIFADDKSFHYTVENSVARHIGPNSTTQSGTIHVLRCPRTICPQPSRYKGQRSELLYPSKVKHLDGCAIVEVRFLNINNILLKSAWYEALGRVMGTKDGVTSGKMVRLLFPRHEATAASVDNEYGQEVPVTSASSNLLHGYKMFDAALYNQVETWRARDLLEWIDLDGLVRFQGLEALSRIDIGALKASLVHVDESQTPLHHVSRIKEGSLVVDFESKSMGLISKFLRHLKWSELHLTDDMRASAVRLSRPEQNLLQYERWKSGIETSIHSALEQSRRKEVFVSCGGMSEDFQVAFLELLRNEFSHLRIPVLFTSRTAKSTVSELVSMKAASAFASEIGSHMQVLVLPERSLGSFAVLLWLRDTLSWIVNKEKLLFGPKDDASLLSFSEMVHEDAQRRNAGFRLAPIAKLIFSLNVGRSGSKYFADILGSVNEVISAHHEVPCENAYCSGGGAVRMQNISLKESYRSRSGVKLPLIRSAVSSTSRKSGKAAFWTRSCSSWDDGLGSLSTGNGDSFQSILAISCTTACSVHSIREVIYAETNPNFKSWFFDIVLDELASSGYSVSVVVIRKYVAAVLKSLYETGYFTNRNGYNWMETVAGVNTNVKIATLQDDSKLDSRDKILSYLLASEARFRHILKKYGQYGNSSKRRVQFIEARSENMFTGNGTLNLLRSLGLEPSTATEKLIGIVSDKYRSNGLTHKKRQLRTTMRDSEEKVLQFRSKVQASSPGVEKLFDAMNRVEGFDYSQ